MKITLKTKREKEVCKKTIGVLKKRLKPGKIFIFGSRAKGTAKYYSDFDFAVDALRPRADKEWELREEIEKFSGLYSVDVVYLKNADKGFRDIVKSTGKVVYEKRT